MTVPEQASDSRSARRAATGSMAPSRAEDVVASLFLAHARSMVSLARLLTDDQGAAEDVVQEAFLSLYNNWWRLREPDAALAYLQRSVVNRSRSVLRHRRIGRSVQLPGLSDEPPADGPALEHEEQANLRELLARLPRRQRQVLVLRYYRDLSEKQIADVLDISPGSVKRHASRGIDRLAAFLQGGDPR